MLTYISHKRSGLKFFLVGTDRHLIQHVLILWNETIYATPRKKNTYQQANACKYLPPKVIHTTKVVIFLQKSLTLYRKLLLIYDNKG
jgi:hypothetical protein